MSRILLISPDYASHYYPLSAIGRALSSRGHQIVVATGPSLGGKVVTDGFEHEHLVLGPGSNPGLHRVEDQTIEERQQMERFFDVTERGMVPTLLHQARNRLRDLLWEPGQVAEDLRRLLEVTRPDSVIVDHLAFGATAALRGLGQPFLSFHPGHPSAFSVSWPYGFPPQLPVGLRDESGLDELWRVCQRVVDRFGDEYSDAVRALDPEAQPIADPFATLSPHGLLVNYPESLGARYRLPADTRFIGSAVRTQRLDSGLRERLAMSPNRPRVYVSLGSFFSARSDLLRKLVAAFRDEPVEVVLATGVTDPGHLGPMPDDWIVAAYYPQPAVIAECDLVVTHGGNNTVTESLTAGVPMLVGPLSTDQHAAAADIEDSGLGRFFDPNRDAAHTISDLANQVLGSEAVIRAAELGSMLRDDPGEEAAADVIEDLLAEPALA